MNVVVEMTVVSIIQSFVKYRKSTEGGERLKKVKLVKISSEVLIAEKNRRFCRHHIIMKGQFSYWKLFTEKCFKYCYINPIDLAI